MEQPAQTPDIGAAFDIVKDFVTEADANYQKNKDLAVKLQGQVNDLSVDVEDLGKKKIEAKQQLEKIATDITATIANFTKERQEFEQSLVEAKQIRDSLEKREKAAADKLQEADTKLAAAQRLNEELRKKEIRLNDLAAVIRSRG